MEARDEKQHAILNPQPTAAHKWLQKLIGTWKAEGEPAGDSTMDPVEWTETVEALGDLWIVARADGVMPDGDPADTMMTLGYDLRTDRFVGTFVGSMMTHLWVYDGWLDESGTILTLESDGPDFENPEVTLKYRDIIELQDDGRRLLRSEVRGQDGNWTEFMRSPYRRIA